MGRRKTQRLPLNRPLAFDSQLIQMPCMQSEGQDVSHPPVIHISAY